MGRLVTLAVLCALGATACGESTTLPSADVPTVGVSAPPTVGAPAPPETGPSPSVKNPSEVRIVTTDDGHALGIPVLGVEQPDPRFSAPRALPDFVLAAEYWIIDDTYAIGAIIQNEIPKYLDEELVDVVKSDGVEWKVYVSKFEGPHVTFAVSVVDGIAYTMGVSTFGAELPDPPPLEVLMSALPSVVVGL